MIEYTLTPTNYELRLKIKIDDVHYNLNLYPNYGDHKAFKTIFDELIRCYRIVHNEN